MDVLRKQSFTNLNLQICLNYFSLFSVLYLLIIGSLVYQKILFYQYQNFQIQKYLLPFLFLIWFLIEIIRICYGFTGNLYEKVSDLLTYLLMTLFPQIPLIFYLTFFQELLFPIDILMGVLMMIGLILQLFYGYYTLRIFITNQTAQFLRLCDHPE